jgi:GNAT superfamily N-acetyltransferase
MRDARPFEIDDDPTRLDLDAIWAFMSAEAYWARWRSKDDVAAQIAASWRVIGAYVEGEQVGFARAISDGVALAYLADVYVIAAHRGRGVAQALVRAMVDDGPGSDFRWMLHTRDAHDLYRRFGFVAPDASLLERPTRRPPTRRPAT